MAPKLEDSYISYLHESVEKAVMDQVQKTILEPWTLRETFTHTEKRTIANFQELVNRGLEISILTGQPPVVEVDPCRREAKVTINHGNKPEPVGIVEGGYVDAVKIKGKAIHAAFMHSPNCSIPIGPCSFEFDLLKNRGEREMKNQECLYEVTMITTKREILLSRVQVIAATQEDAKLEAGVFEKMKEAGLKAKDVNVVCAVVAHINVED